MRSKGGLQKPSSPPKGINVGGFGASDEVEENDEIQNIVEEDASDVRHHLLFHLYQTL